MLKIVFCLMGVLGIFFIQAEEAPKMFINTYLIPHDHPAKNALDAIFSKGYCLENIQALKRVGFFARHPRDPRQLIVAKHPSLPQYIIKTFLDNHHEINLEWNYYIDRIVGAQLIQKSIDAHHYNHLMKVPKKWLYGIPHAGKRKYILVVENMQLVSPAKNAERYLKKINREYLDALYTILTENLLIDSVYIDNIPFSTDGKIAFIDTEHFQTLIKPLQLEKLLPKLSAEMQSYWSKRISEKRHE